MELTQLRYFVTIAETSSFTEAAARVHVSQPALSYQIKQLENELGARLFERTSRRVSLTTDGRAFLPLAQSVLSKADEAKHIMEERLGVESGEVSFGTIPSVGAQVVPHILSTFRVNFPGVTVRLVEAGSQELERSVLDGESDFAILSAPSATERLDVTPLMVEELLLVAPLHHELAQQPSVSIRQLAGEQFVLLGESFTLTQQIKAFCQRAGFEPRVAYRTDSLESLRSFVRHGLGVSILPRLAMEYPVDEMLTSVTFEEGLTRDLNLIRAKDRYATVATRALMVHVRTTLLSTFSTMGRPVGPR
jgi:DNA-binding transcriptional LysR family regulator